MYVLIFIVWIAGQTPLVVLHDFAKEERCISVGQTIEAVLRTALKTGTSVKWFCTFKEESAVATDLSGTTAWRWQLALR